MVNSARPPDASQGTYVKIEAYFMEVSVEVAVRNVKQHRALSLPHPTFIRLHIFFERLQIIHRHEGCRHDERKQGMIRCEFADEVDIVWQG
jgi:hypothetical protein